MVAYMYNRLLKFGFKIDFKKTLHWCFCEVCPELILSAAFKDKNKKDRLQQMV